MTEPDIATPTGCPECQPRAALATRTYAVDAHSVDRRTFVAQSAFVAAAALLATACGGAADSTGPNVDGPITGMTLNVANYPALASVGGIARVNAGNGTPLAIVRTSTTTFAAFSLICPHMGCTVGITGSTSGAAFQCPCHGAMFSSTGAWVGGQRTSGLRSVAIAYDATANTLTIG